MSNHRNRSPKSRTAPTITVNKPNTIHPAQLWLEDMNRDIDITTGYLRKNPQGVYGRKVRELINHALSQSSEVKAIENSRKSKVHPFITYTFKICSFLTEYILPILMAAYSSYIYNRMDSEPKMASPTIPKDYQPPDTNIKKAMESGGFMGELTYAFLSIPIGFIMGFADKGLRLSELIEYLMESSRTIIYTPILFLFVYFITLFVSRFLLNLYSLWMAEKKLWLYQEIVLIETERILERAITSIMRPHLIDHYHAFLDTNSNTAVTKYVHQLRTQYNGREDGVKNAIIDRLVHTIKLHTFADLMRLGNVSPEYLNGVHMLIRHADESLSTIMFNLNRELNTIPTTINSINPINLFAA